jgi:hypothetical protein
MIGQIAVFDRDLLGKPAEEKSGAGTQSAALKRAKA